MTGPIEASRGRRRIRSAGPRRWIPGLISALLWTGIAVQAHSGDYRSLRNDIVDTIRSVNTPDNSNFVLFEPAIAIWEAEPFRSAGISISGEILASPFQLVEKALPLAQAVASPEPQQQATPDSQLRERLSSIGKKLNSVFVDAVAPGRQGSEGVRRNRRIYYPAEKDWSSYNGWITPPAKVTLTTGTENSSSPNAPLNIAFSFKRILVTDPQAGEQAGEVAPRAVILVRDIVIRGSISPNDVALLRSNTDIPASHYYSGLPIALNASSPASTTTGQTPVQQMAIASTMMVCFTGPYVFAYELPNKP